MSTDIKGLNLSTSALFYLKITAGASSEIIAGGFGKAVVAASSTLSVSLASFAANASFFFSAAVLAYQKTIVNGQEQTMQISAIKKKTAEIAAAVENSAGQIMMIENVADTYALATEVNANRIENSATCAEMANAATDICDTVTETVQEMNTITQDHKAVSNEINELMRDAKQIIADCKQVITSQSSTVDNNVALFGTDKKSFGTSIID